MRNITFNKKLFYSRDKSNAILVLEATAIVNMLYKTSKIVNAGGAIKLPIIEREDLLLNLPAKQQLRGKPLEGS